MIIVNSALTDNSSTTGAGGNTNLSTLTLQNVTISGNQGETGSNILASGPSSLDSVTLANDSAQGNGGGLNGNTSGVNLKKTLIADNLSGGNGPDWQATLHHRAIT